MARTPPKTDNGRGTAPEAVANEGRVMEYWMVDTFFWSTLRRAPWPSAARTARKPQETREQTNQRSATVLQLSYPRLHVIIGNGVGARYVGITFY